MSPQPFTPAQLMLLARGAIRLDGAIPPLVTDVPDLIRSSDVAASQLAKRKLANWIDVVDGNLGWKQKANRPIGLVITDLGRAALEAIEAEVAEMGPAASKIGQVIAMLSSPSGVSLIEIVTTTGWLPHSARAALTGLRKRGFTIYRQAGVKGQTSRYRIREMEVAQ